MEGLAREVLILFAVCALWTWIATPKTAELFASMQFVKNSDQPARDFVGKARFARCGVYAMCACIPFGPRIQYPYNWLVIIVLWPVVFATAWQVFLRLERNHARTHAESDPL